jgi:hypothetical protein
VCIDLLPITWLRFIHHEIMAHKILNIRGLPRERSCHWKREEETSKDVGSSLSNEFLIGIDLVAMLGCHDPGQRQGDDVGDQRDPDRVQEDQLQQFDVADWHVRGGHPEERVLIHK